MRSSSEDFTHIKKELAYSGDINFTLSDTFENFNNMNIEIQD